MGKRRSAKQRAALEKMRQKRHKKQIPSPPPSPRPNPERVLLAKCLLYMEHMSILRRRYRQGLRKCVGYRAQLAIIEAKKAIAGRKMAARMGRRVDTLVLFAQLRWLKAAMQILEIPVRLVGAHRCRGLVAPKRDSWEWKKRTRWLLLPRIWKLSRRRVLVPGIEQFPLGRRPMPRSAGCGCGPGSRD